MDRSVFYTKFQKFEIFCHVSSVVISWQPRSGVLNCSLVLIEKVPSLLFFHQNGGVSTVDKVFSKQFVSRMELRYFLDDSLYWFV